MLLGTIETLTVGDSLEFTIRRPQYPATLWTCQFVLSIIGSKMASKDAVAVVDDFLFSLTSEDTNKYKTGKCQAWVVFTLISDPNQRFTESLGILYVLPNPLAALPPSETKQQLDLVLKAIRTVMSAPAASVSFNGQSYSLHNLGDLFEMRDRLQVAYANELAELGIPVRGAGFKTIRTRFV